MRHASTSPAIALLVGLGALLADAGRAAASPKPRRDLQHYDLSMLGFNDGAPYRVRGAEADGVLEDPDLRVFEFQGADWTAKDRKGRLVSTLSVSQRFPERPPSDLFRLYRFDVDGDGVPEFLVLPTQRLHETGGRFAPSILSVSESGFKVAWHGGGLTGERFRVADIRDLNGDQSVELLLVAEGGKSGAYQFMALVAKGARDFQTFLVQNVDSLHYVDLDRDGRIEIVHRERVGRKGAAHQWTYIDHLYRWSGSTFEPALSAFPRYHDEQTIPSLVGDLLDNYDARMPVLEEKIEALQRVRASTHEGRSPPSSFRTRKVKALALAQKMQFKRARPALEALHEAWPFNAQVQLALARTYEQAEEWSRMLEAATRAISLEPTSREAWFAAGVAFAELQERSASLASIYLSAALGGGREEGIAFLRARRGEPGMDSDRQAIIDAALEELARVR